MSKSEALKSLSGLQLAFGKEFTEKRLDFYVNNLLDINPILLEKAVKKIIITKSFLPSITEIRECAQDIQETINGTKVKDVDEAWQEVLGQIHEAFVYHKPQFSTPEIEQAALSMGWDSLCNMLTTEVGTYRAQFRDMYKTVCARKQNSKVNSAIGVSENKRVGMQSVGQIMGFAKENENK